MSNVVNNYFLEILADFDRNISNLSIGITIPQETWIYKARDLTSELIIFTSDHNLKDIYNNYSLDKIYEFQIALSSIDELNKILKIENSLKENSRKNYVNKIHILLDIRKTPFLPEEENEKSSLGRDTLFELRLLSRFIKSGYAIEIPKTDHPDFKFFTSQREYSVECKRIFSSDSFKNSIIRAIRQLKKYSLQNKNEYGVVAINISKFFNVSKNNFFVAKDENEAKLKIKTYYSQFMTETIEAYKTIKFPLKVPLIIFEYSTLGIISGELKPLAFTDYSDSQQPSGGISLYQTFKKDLEPMSKHFKHL